MEIKETQKSSKIKRHVPGPGFEPGLLRPQRSVLTTRRSRRATEEEAFRNAPICSQGFAKFTSEHFFTTDAQ